MLCFNIIFVPRPTEDSLADLVLTNSVGQRNTSKILTNWKIVNICLPQLVPAWSSVRLKQGWSSRHRVVASYMYIVLIARSFVHLFVQHVLVFVFPWISLIICLSWSIKTTSFCSFFEGLAWLKMWIYILLLYPHILRMTSYQPCDRSREDYLTS